MMTLALALGLTAAAANADYRVVPLPREIAAAKGDAYRLTGVTRIVYQAMPTWRATPHSWQSISLRRQE